MNKTIEISKLILVGIILFSIKSTSAQTFEGTMISMVICNDGIVVGSDSRATIRGNGNALAYIDSKDKSHQIFNYVVAFSGRSFMWNNPLYEFIKYVPKKDSLDNIKTITNKLVRATLDYGDSKGIASFLTQTLILIAGFDGDTPFVCKTNYGFTEIDCSQKVISNMFVPEVIVKPLINSSMDKAIQILNQLYIENESIPMSIGGQTKFWKISSQDKVPLCAYNCNYPTQLTLPQNYNAIINNSIVYNLIVPFSEEYLKQYLTEEIQRITK